MNEVFISYSTRDREVACAIRSWLRENGISCWMAPESIPTGSNYTREIPAAIRGCKVFLLLLSENSQQSPWVLRELDSAVNNNKYILPYLLDDKPMVDEFQFLLTGCQWHLSWQENALESLVDRIKVLLPPPEEVKPVAPAPEPVVPMTEVPVPPAAEPEAPPAAPGIVVCPACGSGNTRPLKNDRRSYTPGEWLRFVLTVPTGLAAFGFLFYFVESIMDAFGICVKQKYFYSIDTFTDLGITIITLLALAGSVGIGMLCHRRIRRWICHSRTRHGFRANGMVCRDCRKKFRITVPTLARFPWETAAAPRIPQPGVAFVCCPACGTADILPRKHGEGSWDKKEKWAFLPAWIAGALSVFLFVLPLDNLLKNIPFLVASETGPYATLNPLGILVAFCATLALAYGVVRLVRIPLKELIRRKRVRSHIRACGYTCPACRIRFRITAPLNVRFPHETQTGAAAANTRRGK